MTQRHSEPGIERSPSEDDPITALAALREEHARLQAETGNVLKTVNMKNADGSLRLAARFYDYEYFEQIQALQAHLASLQEENDPDCVNCDHGVCGGKPCETCGGTGFRIGPVIRERDALQAQLTALQDALHQIAALSYTRADDPFDEHQQIALAALRGPK